MSRLSLEYIPTGIEESQDENQIDKALLVKIKCNILKAKQIELGTWKKGVVYTEHIGEGQDCISL